jgi:hypothetical protein
MVKEEEVDHIKNGRTESEFNFGAKTVYSSVYMMMM